MSSYLLCVYICPMFYQKVKLKTKKIEENIETGDFSDARIAYIAGKMLTRHFSFKIYIYSYDEKASVSSLRQRKRGRGGSNRAAVVIWKGHIFIFWKGHAARAVVKWCALYAGGEVMREKERKWSAVFFCSSLLCRPSGGPGLHTVLYSKWAHPFTTSVQLHLIHSH